jgi:cob(I)alamin adenosyltransferase
MSSKGYIHIYTGTGKGKTTAALGLSLRAAGAGKKILFAQFVKGRPYSEIKAIEKFIPNITIRQYGLECFIVKTPTEKDISAAREGLSEINKILSKGIYDIIILDEATIAIYYKLFSSEELIDALKKKKNETEIIITGRYAPPELIDIADLVTDMQEIKHYYSKGIKARKGIEY